jgi:small subunit ribosomal protein S15
MTDIVQKWGKAPNDTGNTCVQLALLTQKVRYLEEHLQQHRKDHCARRRLAIVVANRRNLFKYLKRKDVAAYYELLKDQVVEDKFLMHKNE